MIEAASQRILDAQKIDRAQKAQHRVRLKRNSVKTIYRDLEVENELEEGYFDDHVEAIKSCVYRGKKASGLGNSQTSPLSELEPLLVDYCIKLSEIGQGKKATIVSLEDEELVLKLMEMGFLEGEEIAVEQIAPLGDPISVMVAGYQVSLRISEADSIIVEEN